MRRINKNRIACHDFLVVDNKMYISDLNYNALYKCNIDGSSVELISTFPNEKTNARHLHGAMCALNEKIYFAPMNGKCVAIYNLTTGEMKSTDITDKVGMDGSKYYSICHDEKNVYMIPSRAEYIIKIDVDSDELEFHNEWMKNIDFYKNKEIPAIKNGAFMRNGLLYIPFERQNYLIQVDLNTFLSKTIRIGDGEKGFVDAYYDKEKDVVWLLRDGESSVIKYSFSTLEEQTYHLKDSDVSIKYPYVKMVKLGNRLIVIPFQESDFFCVDMISDEVKCLKHLDYDNDENEWGVYYHTAKKISEDLFVAIDASEFAWEQYNEGCDLCDKLVIEDAGRVVREMLYNTEDGMFRENWQVGLTDYLDFLAVL